MICWNGYPLCCKSRCSKYSNCWWTFCIVSVEEAPVSSLILCWNSSSDSALKINRPLRTKTRGVRSVSRCLSYQYTPSKHRRHFHFPMNRRPMAESHNIHAQTCTFFEQMCMVCLFIFSYKVYGAFITETQVFYNWV